VRKASSPTPHARAARVRRSVSSRARFEADAQKRIKAVERALRNGGSGGSGGRESAQAEAARARLHEQMRQTCERLGQVSNDMRRHVRIVSLNN
jgi:hypothetical protein